MNADTFMRKRLEDPYFAENYKNIVATCEGFKAYDSDGYDEYGYDKFNKDRDGIDRFDENRFDENGFDENGFDKNGFDRFNKNRDGIERNEVEFDRLIIRAERSDETLMRKRFEDPYFVENYKNIVSEWEVFKAYDSDGYDEYGYDKFKKDRDGIYISCDENGFDKNGFNKDGYDQFNKNIDGIKREEVEFDRMIDIMELNAEEEYENIIANAARGLFDVDAEEVDFEDVDSEEFYDPYRLNKSNEDFLEMIKKYWTKKTLTAPAA